jgi:hypothetical protein
MHRIPLLLYDEVLDPFNLTLRQVINIYELGYDYASQQILVEGVYALMARKRRNPNIYLSSPIKLDITKLENDFTEQI